MYQKAKSAVGPVPAIEKLVIVFAHTRVALVQGLVHVSPAVPGDGLPTRQPPTMCASLIGFAEVPIEPVPPKCTCWPT